MCSVLVLIVATTALARADASSIKDTPLTRSECVSTKLAARNPILIMLDGQIQSRMVKVFLRDVNVAANVAPKLFLHSSDNTFIGEYSAAIVDRDHQWQSSVNGTQVNGSSGTLMFFDVSRFDFGGWTPVARVSPVVTWPGDQCIHSISAGDKDVYLVNACRLWTSSLIVLAVILSVT